ncbi:MAG: histone deacetylase family protein [Alphaproteobacteria bacterium]|nr:histone deacetylase family protein [Alphaproteobacteria bacterium]
MKTAIYTSDAFLSHDTGANHPECSSRIEMLNHLFEEEFQNIPIKSPYDATEEDISLAHPVDHIYNLMDRLPDTGYAGADEAGECILSPGSWKAITKSVGAGLTALQDINDGEITRAFCASRPPGHHAESTKPMGFCFFNNAFITARAAQERFNLNKVAIVDFDVHHGNGTDALTRNHNEKHPDKPIFYASTHQYPLWPMSGLPEDNTDHVINVGLPEGTNGPELIKVYEDKIFPALNAYKPDLLILSSGFDAHKDDPLAGLNLENHDFAALTAALVGIANKHAKGRIISLLEGGYNLEALKSSVRAHLNAFV